MYNTNTAGKAAAFKTALRTLDRAPKKIREARDVYSEAIKQNNTPEAKRIYSEVYRENTAKAARETRDAEIKKQVDEIRAALAVVREGREFPDSKLDVSNAKLMNAVTMINAVGHSLDPIQQIDIANQFRGDPASLKFLGQIYAKNNLYYADYVASMAKPIPQQALDDLEYCVNRFDYCGGVWDDDSDAKIMWTKGEFAKASERYGYEDSEIDPFEDALYFMKQRYADDPDAQKAAGYAIRQMQTEDMTPTEKANLFNQTADTIKSKAAERTDQQTRYDAAQYKAENHGG